MREQRQDPSDKDHDTLLPVHVLYTDNIGTSETLERNNASYQSDGDHVLLKEEIKNNNKRSQSGNSLEKEKAACLCRPVCLRQCPKWAVHAIGGWEGGGEHPFGSGCIFAYSHVR